jgi:hypothetical protein
MLGSVVVTLLLALPTAPPSKPEPPSIKLVSSKNGLTFEVANPNAEALPYVGYTSDSFEGGLKPGIISPMYRIELLKGKEWTAYNIGWCGTGLGPVSIPAKGKATFTLIPPPGEWDKFRVGMTWFKTTDRKELAVAWSDPIGKDDIAGKKP